MRLRKWKTNHISDEKMERLEKAEEDLRNLKSRAEKAIQTLDDRHKRNHWRESITEMIQGA
jgi:hypothetical protein